MGTMASQITSLTIVLSTVNSSADHRKHQSSASLSFVRGILRWPVNSPHKWPVTPTMYVVLLNLMSHVHVHVLRVAERDLCMKILISLKFIGRLSNGAAESAVKFQTIRLFITQSRSLDNFARSDDKVFYLFILIYFNSKPSMDK